MGNGNTIAGAVGGIDVFHANGNLAVSNVRVLSFGVGLLTTGMIDADDISVFTILTAIEADAGGTVDRSEIRSQSGGAVYTLASGFALTDVTIYARAGGVVSQGFVEATRSSIRTLDGIGVGALADVRLDASTVTSSNGPAVLAQSVSAVNTTITESTNGISANRVVLAYSTIANNGTNVGAAVSLDIFGSVIASPTNGPDCIASGSVTSYGYNVDDDGTCGLGAGPGDRSNLQTPLELSALTANVPGELVPGPGSPLLNVIPSAACQLPPLAVGVVTDERGITRPQFGLCDVGAVEALDALLVRPRFAG